MNQGEYNLRSKQIAMAFFDDLPKEARDIINYSSAVIDSTTIRHLMKVLIEDEPDDVVEYVRWYVGFMESAEKSLYKRG